MNRPNPRRTEGYMKRDALPVMKASAKKYIGICNLSFRKKWAVHPLLFK
jgi:hypothetical protein